MGYQVGTFCYLDKGLAEDVYFSQVPPQITADGVKSVKKLGNNWYFGNQRLEANLPICDPIKNFDQGVELGTPFIFFACTYLIFKVIVRMLR